MKKTLTALLLATLINPSIALSKDKIVSDAQKNTLSKMGYTLGENIEPRNCFENKCPSENRAVDTFSSGLIPGQLYWYIDINPKGEPRGGTVVSSHGNSWATCFIDGKGRIEGTHSYGKNESFHLDRVLRTTQKVRAFDYLKRKR